MEAGDWTCGACDMHNFKARKVCYGCAKPRSMASSVSMVTNVVVEERRGGGGDWKCSCGELNFANRTRCWKCPLGRTGSAKQRKEWDCPNPKCDELNFEHRTVCRRCNTPKDGPIPQPVAFQQPVILSNSECVVCLERPKTHMIKQCRHLCCCDICGFAMNTCPLCRCAYSPDTDLIHVFI